MARLVYKAVLSRRITPWAVVPFLKTMKSRIPWKGQYNLGRQAASLFEILFDSVIKKGQKRYQICFPPENKKELGRERLTKDKVNESLLKFRPKNRYPAFW